MPFDIPFHDQAPVGDIEMLMDARARISNRDGWIQGRFEDGGRHCLVGALSLACNSHSFSLPNRTERRLARQLVKHLPPDATLWARARFIPARHRLMSFNDHPRTCHDDVVAVYDRAILHLTNRLPVCVAA